MLDHVFSAQAFLFKREREEGGGGAFKDFDCPRPGNEQGEEKKLENPRYATKN